MATAQEALVARQLAVDEVRRLLSSTDDLEKLDTLLSDYDARYKANTKNLSSVLESQTEATRSGLDMLEHAYSSLEQLEHNFQLIDTLCIECQSLVDFHDKIQRLSTVHSNVTRTLRDVEAVASLPVDANEADALLQDNKAGLLQAYEYLAMLEGTSYKARKALQNTATGGSPFLLSGLNGDSNGGGSNSGSSSGKNNQLASLNSYFEQVQRAMSRFEERLWSTVRNYQTVAIAEPWLLVSALQVVEMQEIVDSQLLISAGDASGRTVYSDDDGSNTAADGNRRASTGHLVKGWKRKCIQQITSCIQEAFAPLLQQCSQLAGGASASPNITPSKSNTSTSSTIEAGEQLNSLLQQATGRVKELYSSEKAIKRCFPPHFGIIPLICNQYVEQLSNMIDMIGICAANLTNSQILQVLAWVETYNGVMSKIGGGSTATFEGSRDGGVDQLTETYVNRIASKLESWLTNLVAADFSGHIEVSTDGKVWTPGAVELFRILNEQLDIVLEMGMIHGNLVNRLGQTSILIMMAFQSQAKKKLGTGTELDVVCAMANNGIQCAQTAAEYVARLEAVLPSNTRLNMEEACHGYIDLSKHAISVCVAIVFTDPGVFDLLQRVGSSDEWRRGTTIGSVLATLDDFLQDFNRLLEEELCESAAEQLMSEAVSHLLAAYLTHMRVISDAEVNALRRDATSVSNFCQRVIHIPTAEAFATSLCQPLFDLAEFLASDSEEAFLLSYTALLESAPGITPTLLSTVLAGRVAAGLDMSKTDAKEVLAGCRDVYAAAQQHIGSSTAFTDDNMTTGSGATPFASSPYMTAGKGRLTAGKDAAFRAALQAARKRTVKNTSTATIAIGGGGTDHVEEEEGDDGSGPSPFTPPAAGGGGGRRKRM